MRTQADADTDGRALPRPPAREQPRLLRQLFTHPHSLLDELNDRWGPMTELGGGPMRMAVIGDPAAIHELSRLPMSSFRWNHRYNVLGFVTGRTSMVVSDGDEWKRRRAPVQVAFSRRRIDGWIPTIVDQADVAIDGVVTALDGERREMDLAPVVRQLVLEIVVRTLFGERMSARAGEIGELMRRPQAYLESSGIRQLPHPFPGTARARVKADRAAFDTLIDEQIADRRADPTGDPLDVLETLVADSSLSDAEIRDQVVTLVGAGYDTTAASLAWMLRRVPLVPGLLDRLRVEADEVLGPVVPRPTGVTLEADVLGRLVVAGRTVRETLRLHPAGAVSPREARSDVQLGGYRIRKGTMVLWSAHLAGRDPKVWERPLDFDPDRFADLTPEREASADLAWVPFGRGPRACIGFALAQTELTLITARLAQRLDLGAVTSEEPEPVGLVVNRPQGGAPLLVSARA